jgi:hypothetical protein
MRRLSLTLLVCLLVLPAAALAARADKGDGVFELKTANGTFDLTGHGVVLGQMDKGVLRVQDLTPNDNAQKIAVSGADRPPHAGDDPDTMVYIGSNIHIRISGGKYHIHFKGSGVDLTAIGVGVAELTGSALAFDPGDYRLDGAKWTAVPFIDKFVPYGPQPVGPTTGP